MVTTYETPDFIIIVSDGGVSIRVKDSSVNGARGYLSFPMTLKDDFATLIRRASGHKK